MKRAFQAIVVGIEDYDDPTWKRLPGVSETAVRVAKALGAEPLPLAKGGAKDEAPRLLKEVIKQIPERATLFVHWIGHGVTASDQHYLICRDSPPNRLDSYEAVASGELGLILANSRAERVVVVLDTCFSGAGAGNLAQRYRDSLAKELDRDGWERVACVIAASHPLDKAVAGRFSQGLAEALEHPDQHLKWTKADQYIDPEKLAVAVKGLLGDANKTVHPRFSKEGIGQDIIPNPLYKPEAGNADIETRSRLEGVFGEEAHFNLASRGIEIGEAGYFFSGRRRSQEQIINWLQYPYSSLMVVTGPPGSGKSALLGRVVTLSVPQVRAEVNKAGGLSKDDPVPPDDAVDVAVHAKGKNVFQVATALGQSVGLDREVVDQPGIVDVLSAIEEADTPLTEEVALKGLTIVIDALDEAGGEQAQRIANELIRPLAKVPNVRLLVGTRRSLDGGLIPDSEGKHDRLLQVFGPDVDILDLENETQTQADIAEFMAKRLREVAVAQRGSDQWIKAAAVRVAEAADGSFLYARLVARSLEATPDAPLEVMPADASAAFVQDIAARYPEDQKRIADMLRSLAFSLGLGLSRTVWAPIATALNDEGDIYGDDDIIWMLRRVGSYIVETTVVTDGIGQAVYRLIHQALADHLRDGVTKAHIRIVDALCRGLKGEAWLGADPYLRRHLLDHAALADQEELILPAVENFKARRSERELKELFGSCPLEPLITTPGVLAISEPDSVLNARVNLLSENARHIIGVYMVAAVDLPGLTPAERWALLHLTALMQGDKALAEVWEPPKSSPWRCSWARTRPVTPHITLKGHSGPVYSIALGEIDGRAVIISGGWDGTVRLWDAKDRMPIGNSLTGHEGSISSVVVAEVLGLPVIVSGGRDGTVRLWDAKGRKSLGEPVTGHVGSINSLALGEVDHKTVIVSGGIDGTVRLWDAKDRKPLGDPLIGHISIVNSVAVAEVEGRKVIVSGGCDGTVRLWDAKDRKPFGEPLIGHTSIVNSVAVAEVEGRVVIASGGNDGVRLWDAKDRMPIGDLLTAHEGCIYSVSVAEVEGRTVIISGGWDGTVRLWDAKDRKPLGDSLTGHVDSIDSLALGEIDHMTVIVSGGCDGTVRLWDTKVRLPIGDQLRSLNHHFHCFTINAIKGRELILSGGFDGSVQLWDAENLMPTGELLIGHTAIVNSVAVAEVEGRTVIVSGGNDGVRLWDAKDRMPIGDLLTAHDGFIYTVAVAEVEGRTVIVSGGDDGTVRMWDAKDRKPLGDPLIGHTGIVHSVSVAELEGRVVIVSGGDDGTVRLWDAKECKPLGDPITVHMYSFHPVVVAELHGRSLILWLSHYGYVELFDLKERMPIGMITNNEGSSISSFAVGEVDNRAVIILACMDGTVSVCDLLLVAQTTPELLSRMSFSLGQEVRALALGLKGHLAVACTRGLLMIRISI